MSDPWKTSKWLRNGDWIIERRKYFLLNKNGNKYIIYQISMEIRTFCLVYMSICTELKDVKNSKYIGSNYSMIE